jgi:hypothetical protein
MQEMAEAAHFRHTGPNGLLGYYGGAGPANDTTGIVLPEGYGFAFVPPNSDSTIDKSFTQMYMMTFVFKDDLGRTFGGSCELLGSPSAGVASFVLFNGTGSGRTLTLLSMDYSVVGYYSRNLSLKFITLCDGPW